MEQQRASVAVPLMLMLLGGADVLPQMELLADAAAVVNERSNSSAHPESHECNPSNQKNSPSSMCPKLLMVVHII